MSGSATPNIHDNTINVSGGDGIAVAGTSTSTIYNNTINASGAGVNGISASNTALPNIYNNSINVSGSSAKGIYFASTNAQAADIYNNTIIDSPIGISFGSTRWPFKVNRTYLSRNNA